MGHSMEAKIFSRKSLEFLPLQSSYFLCSMSLYIGSLLGLLENHKYNWYNRKYSESEIIDRLWRSIEGVAVFALDLQIDIRFNKFVVSCQHQSKLWPTILALKVSNQGPPHPSPHTKKKEKKNYYYIYVGNNSIIWFNKIIFTLFKNSKPKKISSITKSTIGKLQNLA